MLNSGLSLNKSLNLLINQMKKQKFINILKEIQNDIQTGKNISNAFKKQDKYFSDFFINMIKIGEKGGFLNQILINLTTYFENKINRRKKVIKTSSYPIIVFVFSISIMIFLLTNIIPTFANSFEDMGVSLPFITKILIFVSNFLVNNFILLSIIFLFFIVFSIYFYKTKKGKQLFDTFLLKIPLLKEFILKNNIIILTQNLHLLLESGVPLLKAIKIVKNSLHNSFIQNKLKIISKDINDGNNITNSFKKHDIFPNLMIRMLDTGENTGNLNEMLKNIYIIYQNQVEEKFDTIISWLEPTFIIILSLFVGGIVASIMLPIFSMMQGV